ncbi:MAG TPA: hypothetical protein VF534_27245 [Paraburkholderia sp.]
MIKWAVLENIAIYAATAFMFWLIWPSRLAFCSFVLLALINNFKMREKA